MGKEAVDVNDVLHWQDYEPGRSGTECRKPVQGAWSSGLLDSDITEWTDMEMTSIDCMIPNCRSYMRLLILVFLIVTPS